MEETKSGYESKLININFHYSSNNNLTYPLIKSNSFPQQMYLQ